jgi:hypothetical protein
MFNQIKMRKENLLFPGEGKTHGRKISVGKKNRRNELRKVSACDMKSDVSRCAAEDIKFASSCE